MRRFFLAAIAVVCMLAAPIFTENIAAATQIEFNAPVMHTASAAVPTRRVKFCAVSNFVADRTSPDPSSQKAVDPAPHYHLLC